MGNETSSVHHIEERPKSKPAFKPLFGNEQNQSTLTTTPQPSKKSLPRQQFMLEVPSNKKSLAEINKHVEKMYSYQKQSEEKVKFWQKEREYQQEKECTFKPDTNRQELSATRSFREFLTDQQNYQQKKDNSIRKQSQIKQQILRSQEPIKRESRSPPNNSAFDRLYGHRKLPPKLKSKPKKLSPAHTNRGIMKGQQFYQTFKQKQALKTIQQVPKPNIHMSDISQQILYTRGVRQFMDDLSQTVKDKHRISYIEFCEMLKNIGFTTASTVSENMIKERSLVYDAWGRLKDDGVVDYRSMMSFCFAVLGVDLAKYWEEPEEKTVIRGNHQNSNDSCIEDNQTLDHFFPNQRGRLIIANSQHGFNPNKSDGWSSFRPSVRMEPTKSGMKFFSLDQIAEIRQSFLTFSVNRMSIKKVTAPEKSPLKSPRSSEEEEKFKTRRLRILDEAVREGLILTSEGASHADYLIVSKRLEDLKIQRQRQQKQKQSLVQATFQPVISDYEFKNQQHIRDRMRYTAQQRGQALYEKSQNSCRTFHSSGGSPPQNISYNFVPDTSKGKVNTNPVYAKDVNKFVNRIRQTVQKRNCVNEYLNDRDAARVPALSPDKQQLGEETEVVLHVDVNLDKSRIERISLRPGNNPKQVAMAFVKKHHLDNRFVDQLTELLRQNLLRLH